jgi:WD40 repeat protein
MKRKIKGYVIEEEIGEGGFGVVYRATQPVIEREVAIKVILPEFVNDADFIRNFLTEAQLVARLEHPHIVPLYDYWRDKEGAFLVMRWLRGGSLLDWLRENGAMKVDAIATMLDQIASALDTAHRHKIIHQDIKPANILLDEYGNSYLTDFGIAQDLEADVNLAIITDSNLVHGSPTYISPEHLRQDIVTHQSDIYSVGLLLYEMLTAQSPWLGIEGDDFLKQRLQINRLPRVQEVNPELPEEINHVIWQASARKPSSRYTSVLKVAEDFRKAILGHAVSVPRVLGVDIEGSATMDALAELGHEPINPYKGLAAFQEADADDFFGRDSLVERLLETMKADVENYRFLAVIGPSGSGKSSAVKAGLIPALRKGAIEALANCFITEMTPASKPMRELEGAILSAATNLDDHLINNLSAGDYKLAEIVEYALPDDGSELILLIDQLEEVFTLSDEKQRLRFLNLIAEAVQAPGCRLRVIVTLRADFYDRPLMYNEFGELVRSRTEVVLPLSPGELDEAIRKPANNVGLSFDSGLVETIISDVSQQPNTLPLLQYALTELYEKRQGLLLTLTAYEESGGISGSLARRANEIYTEFDDVQREAARQLFLRLVNLGEGTEDTRRRALLSELRSGTGDMTIMQHVMDAFGKFRLLTFDRDPTTRTPTVSVAHEALISKWSQLREWLNTNRDELRMQARLAQSTDEWIFAKRDSGFLAADARLIQFAELINSDIIVLSEDERAYIDAGLVMRNRNARRKRIAVALLIVISIVAVTFAGIAFLLKQQADESRNDAEIAQGDAIMAQGIAESERDRADIARDDAVAAEETAVSERDRADIARQDAEFAEATAVAESEISLSRELAASSLINLEHLDLSFLLSLEALEVADTFEAHNSLLTGLQSQPRVETFMHGHTDLIRTLTYSPDASLIATGSSDNTIRLWNAVTYQQVGQPLEGHLDWVNSVAFSPDGQTLVSGGRDGKVILWDVASSEMIDEPFLEHTSEVRSVAFAPDGQTVASGGVDQTIIIWDIETGGSITTLGPDNPDTTEEQEGHASAVYSVVFSPDGTILASGSGDNTILLWNVNTGELVVDPLIGHESWIMSLAFSPDGRILASGSADEHIHFWSPTSGESFGTFTGHRDYVRSLVFNQEEILLDQTPYQAGSLLLSASDDGYVLLWDLAQGRAIDIFASVPNAAIWAADFGPDETTIIAGGASDTLTVWNIDSSPVLGSTLIDHTEQILSIDFHPTEPLFATAGGLDSDYAIRIWNPDTETLVATLEGHGAPVSSVVFNPQMTTQLISADLERMILVWDAETSAIVHSIEFTDSVFSLDFSSDGQLLAIGNNDGTVGIWDVSGDPQDWQLTGHTMTGHTDRVTDVVFSPDGALVASGSRDKTIRLWDVATLESLGEPFIGHTDGITSVDFSPDGTLVASGSRDTNIHIWDIKSGQSVGETLTDHLNWVMDVSFSSDGNYLASSSGDGTVILWDVALARAVGMPFTGHQDWVNVLDFSSDGQYLASGSRDGAIILWSLSLQSWQQQACSIANRVFTERELNLYLRNAESHLMCAQ